MNSSPIVTENLTVRYGSTTALENASLEVPPGSVYALLGRNGAGKSTLIKTLLGYQPANSGKITLLGRDPWSERASLMRSVGVVPEEPDAPPDMKVGDLVTFFSRLYPDFVKEETLARIRKYDIATTQRFQRLSKGQKGIVALALALGQKPSLLVLDDPTLGLDVVARRSFFEELIDELATRGTTVFLTTHELSSVEAVATDVCMLKEGRVVLQEQIETLKQRFRKIRASSLDDTAENFRLLAPVAVRRSALGAESAVGNYSEPVFEQLRAGGASEMEASPMSLEEIFVAVCDTEKEQG